MKTLPCFIIMLAFSGLNEAMCQWNTSGNNIYNTNTGFVGIGNSSPSTLLYVGKNMTEPTITVRNLGGAGGASFRMWDNASGADWKFKATNTGGFKIRDNANSLDVIVIEPGSSANAIYINSSGNLGMGTAAPLAKLHLSVSGYDAYQGLLITSTRTGGKSLSINQGSAGRLNFTNPGVIDLVTLDFNQNNVGIGTVAPASSAALEISSTTKGFLPPRLSMSQITAINSPVDGLIVYCTTDSKFYAYVSSGSLWKEILFGSGTILTGCNSFNWTHYSDGGCAPVDKTVAYAVVGNIPGENGKCWLAQNLGADHQATSFNDATEASAGWYWQFNRKQGYKHDGTSLTPAWTISGISEDLDWVAANDPCHFEFGGNWRIPTYTEWYNVDNAGGWESLNDAYNSGLKLHGAGYLDYLFGSLTSRGILGKYWSSIQQGVNNGWDLELFSFSSGMNFIYKSYGQSIRCLRN